MLILTEEDVRSLLPMPEAVRLVGEAFAAWGRGEAQNQPRRRLFLPTGSVLHSMAGACGRYFGSKVYSTNPKHGAWFHFLLYDAETAEPLALMEANWLGQIRTGAASGYATSLLSKPEASVVGVIGSGFQAASQVAAMRAVRPVSRVLVWSRSAEKRDAFAREHSCDAVDTAEAAVRDADIVVTATNSRHPVFDAAWVGPDAHVNLMGSNHPERREAPGELLARADVLVADSVEAARIEAGDYLLGLDEAGWSRVRDLKTIQPKTTQHRHARLSVFKSVGLGLEDVAVAAHIYEQAIIPGRASPGPSLSTH